MTGLCDCSSVHVKYLQPTFVGTSLLACAVTTGMAHKVCVCVFVCSSGAVLCCAVQWSAVHVRDNMIKGDEESRSECALV